MHVIGRAILKPATSGRHEASDFIGGELADIVPPCIEARVVGNHGYKICPIREAGDAHVGIPVVRAIAGACCIGIGEQVGQKRQASPDLLAIGRRKVGPGED